MMELRESDDDVRELFERAGVPERFYGEDPTEDEERVEAPRQMTKVSRATSDAE